MFPHGANVPVGAAWRAGRVSGLSQFLQIVRPYRIPSMQMSWTKRFSCALKQWNMVSKGDGSDLC